MISCAEAKNALNTFHDNSNNEPPRKFFLRDEVVIHNKVDDVWVIVNGFVLNITSLFQNRTKFINAVNDFLNFILK